MTDLWGFLLQTLTASGVAVLLLIVKAMFRDKLSPRWQFAVWGVLGLGLLLPAGLGGRYVLLNWPFWIEAAKTILAGDYSLTHVLAPIPLPRLTAPGSLTEWLYAVYVAGVLVHLARYFISYFRLRLALNRGTPASAEQAARIAAVAERYGLTPCRAVEVPGLKTAFLCGVLRPVLALPAGAEPDDKVILHELLHRKHRDAAWGLVICFFRCIHWCNPLLWYCADRAGNDLETRCDQRVLEALEGEERRDYGRILLSMADDKYARVPGTSSMANGGRNIRARIESIARFKKYPAGMALVSVCMIVLLTAPLLLGSRAGALYHSGGMDSPMELALSMASARTLRCTTPAGALDAYAKSVLAQNGLYRAMCAPLSEQEEIANAISQSSWDTGLSTLPYTQSGYGIYNLEPVGANAYEGLLVVQLSGPPDGPTEGSGTWLGVQKVRTELQEGRWVVLPLEEFWTLETKDAGVVFDWSWGCPDLPACRYEAQGAGFTIRLEYQSIRTVDSYIQSDSWFSSSPSFDTTPQPHADFSNQHNWISLSAIYTGDPADKEDIHRIAVSYAPMWEGRTRPLLSDPGTSSWTSSDGSGGESIVLEGNWDSEIPLSGGGSNGADRPEAYAANLYLNGQKAAALTLLPVEGGSAS